MIEINKIYNTNCETAMKKMLNNSVDLIVTDAPYGIRKKEKWDNKINFTDKINYWIKESMRISKNGIIWFCSGNMIPIISKNNENNIHRTLIWNKPLGSQLTGSKHNNLFYSFECILVFIKNKELLSKGKKSKIGMAVYDARTIPFSQHNHPTTKPLDLMEWLIEHYSDENDLIMDIFAGSGTTLLACQNKKRKYLGFEIDFNHFKTAKIRLTQSNLFHQPKKEFIKSVKDISHSEQTEYTEAEIYTKKIKEEQPTFNPAFYRPEINKLIKESHGLISEKEAIEYIKKQMEDKNEPQSIQKTENKPHQPRPIQRNDEKPTTNELPQKDSVEDDYEI